MAKRKPKTAPRQQHPRGRLTDIANAERLVARYGDRLRWVQGRHWLVWDGARWRLAAVEEIEALAKDTAKGIWREIPRTKDADVRVAIARHAKQSGYARAVLAMIALARSDQKIALQQLELDRDPYVFNCINGSFDLRRWKFREHHPADLITKLAPVNYDPTAACPTWTQFLDQVMGGNHALTEFLQRTVGYSLTGDVSEQCLFFLYGLGANGKSTFVETIRCLLGDYAQHADSTTFLRQRPETIRTDIARLPGARFVSAAEVPPERLLDEVLIKQLTGGGRVTARDLYKPPFEFDPQFKIWLEGNHKPVVRGADLAIWRRILLIPFSVTIPAAERDPELAGKLRHELPGILNWALAGGYSWLEHGLNPPPEVLAATEDYRQEMDPIGDFIAECCVLDEQATAWKSDLHEVYRTWCAKHQTTPISIKAFGTSIVERGTKEGRTSGGRYWIGIGLGPTEGSDT